MRNLFEEFWVTTFVGVQAQCPSRSENRFSGQAAAQSSGNQKPHFFL